MSGADWAIVVVGVISLVSAFLSGRTARSTAKTQAETEAYARARKMDVETIERQDREIEEIRKNNQDLRTKVRALISANENLKQDNQTLHQENKALIRRVARCEERLGEINGR